MIVPLPCPKPMHMLCSPSRFFDRSLRVRSHTLGLMASAVCLEFVLQATEADAEQLRRLGSVVPRPRQRLQNMSVFELLQGQAEGQLGFFAASFSLAGRPERQIIHVDSVALATAIR